MSKLNIFFSVIAFACILTGCSPKTSRNIDYFQNIATNVQTQVGQSEGLIIQPKDLISVVVSSSNPEVTGAFNLSMKAHVAGSPTDELYGMTDPRLLGYHVSDDGYIDLPIIGKMHVVGKNHTEVEHSIKEALVSKGLLLEPHVKVELLNNKVTVLGEVNRPGSYALQNEKITVLQALSMAGDLTIYGQRNDVKVIREINGKREIYVLNLTSRNFFNSPAYYLQQYDIVYVTPNKVKASQSTINENYLRSGGFVLSLTSLAVVLANFLIKVI